MFVIFSLVFMGFWSTGSRDRRGPDRSWRVALAEDTGGVRVGYGMDVLDGT